jgi:hypothetical protein
MKLVVISALAVLLLVPAQARAGHLRHAHQLPARPCFMEPTNPPPHYLGPAVCITP